MSGIGSAGGGAGSTDAINPNNAFSGSEGASGGAEWRDPSTVWGPQAGYLQGLYGQGQQQLGQRGQYEQGAQGVYDTAVGGYNRLMNPGINPELQAYQGDVQRNMERNIMPAIQGGAGMSGQMGGSRQGVMQGIAMSDANQQVTDMAANLYNDDMNRMSSAMQFAPTLGNFGMDIPWYALNQYANILGAPTVLAGGGGGSQFGSDSSWSSDTGGGGGASRNWNAKVSIGS